MHHGAMMMAARDASDPPPLPATPTGLALTAESSTVLSAAWTDNASNEDGYEVELHSNASFTALVESETLAAGATAKTFTGLVSNTTYWCRVRAFNASGFTPYDTDDEATLSSSVDGPTNVSGLGFGGGSPDGIVWWHEDIADETGFDVQVSDGGGFGIGTDVDTSVAADVEHLEVELTNITGGGNRFVRVRATYAGGVVSDWATTTFRDSNNDAVAAAPSGNALEALSSTSLEQSWTPPGGLATARNLEFQIAEDASFTQKVRTDEDGDETATSHTWTGLEPGTTYYSRVRVGTSSGGPHGPWSATASSPTGAPDAPSAHTVTDQQPDQITHTWTDPDGATHVDIEIAEDAAFTVGVQQDHGVALGTGTKTWTSLDEGTQYWVRVRGANSAGDGDWDTIATASQYATPTSMDATDQGSQWLLTWTEVSTEAPFTELHRDTGSGFTLFDTISAGLGQQAVAKNSGYEWKVRHSINNDGSAPDADEPPNSDFSGTFTDTS